MTNNDKALHEAIINWRNYQKQYAGGYGIITVDALVDTIIKEALTPQSSADAPTPNTPSSEALKVVTDFETAMIEESCDFTDLAEHMRQIYAHVDTLKTALTAPIEKIEGIDEKVAIARKHFDDWMADRDRNAMDRYFTMQDMQILDMCARLYAQGRTQSALPEKLPCDVTIGAATFTRGVKTSLVFDKIITWHERVGEGIIPPNNRIALSQPQILKGVGKIDGDGWKDITKKGEIVFVWNEELPSPCKAGQYPRIGNEIWSASTDQYDFVPATLDEIKSLLSTPPVTAPIEKVDAWLPIESAPKDESLFVCRDKRKPHVTFEAAMFWEQESWEIPEKYIVLQNMTTDEPIDTDWCDLEWQPLPPSARLQLQRQGD